MNAETRVAILGAGNRGRLFARLLKESGVAIAAVAEKDPKTREWMCREYGIPPEMAFENWRQFCGQPRLCDAAVVATMDQEHVEPSVTCLDKGYHLLLEKPMATDLDGMRAISQAWRRSGKVASVCHSLRYNNLFSKLRKLVKEGSIGRLVTIDQLEQVGHAHFSHSFVRGNWSNQARSTFMLMAKCCHDLDYLSWLVDKPWSRVNSFGSLSYFKPSMAPEGAGTHCLNCPIEKDCAYSALGFYVRGKGRYWIHDVFDRDDDPKNRLKRLQEHPARRCVWHCDNDVVDHQIVALEFEGGVTVTLTMTGFTLKEGRKIRVHGTEGELILDESEGTLTRHEFATGKTEEIQVAREAGDHGGGDRRLVDNWLEAIQSNDPSWVATDPKESMDSHLIAFAAEAARLSGTVVHRESCLPLLQRYKKEIFNQPRDITEALT